MSDSPIDKKTSEILSIGMDFFANLSIEDQQAIDESIHQLDNGQFVSHESVQEEIKSRFNF